MDAICELLKRNIKMQRLGGKLSSVETICYYIQFAIVCYNGSHKIVVAKIVVVVIKYCL